jgi:hypothetical protein
MIIQKMQCPYGCKDSVFLESTKRVSENGGNLLLDSSSQDSKVVKQVKVYTCNCCHKSFETPESKVGRMLL